MADLDDAFFEKLAEYGPIGKTLGMVIRPAFVAPPGQTYVWGDWSAIEARVLPWLAASPGAQKQLDVFLASDHDKTRPDVYVYNAAQLLGVDPQAMWDAFMEGEKWAKDGRQSHGKVPVLSLGFGGATGALMKMAINYQVYLSEEQAAMMVEGWRAANAWAKEFWGAFRTDRHTGEVIVSTGLWGAANMALRNPGEAFAAGRVAYTFDPDYLSGTLFCGLPNGGILTYPQCKYRTKTVKDKDTGDEKEVFALWFRKSYGWSSLWYGKLAENITQAVAGRILRETLVALGKLDVRHGGLLSTVGHTHDEIVVQCDDSPKVVPRVKALLHATMLAAPKWRADLPLAVEVTDNWYYTKAPI